ncbi:hypothetical protein TCE0_013r01030 [Talaromyces pinophilus]|uniref:DUF1593 domain-containing protein n=1 Tax=Talaromyces pinophilus TaxID=128442 RepID=A0A698XMS3_TALPI|nr:hypothetical protein TCE0_013r01030 [Talaromyces pinophilus]
MKNKVCPQDMRKIVDCYEKVVENLNAHAHPNDPYPSAEYLRSLIKKGAETYGMSAVGDDIPLSEGGQLLLERIEAPSEQPLWILCWGGTNTLASVLLKIENTHSASEAAQLRSKLRVYAISDQDDTGVWIRNKYPDIFYICSVHGWSQYGLAAWSGISGERWYGFDHGGPDPSKITKEWIRENIQIGPLGSVYPDFMFIPEGDTPTFLYLIQNGLGVPEHPDYGSWGGRYNRTDASGHGVINRHFSDVADDVIGLDGRRHKSNQATVWRWRNAFQNDFAARMRWTLSPDLGSANHNPVISINGSTGTHPLQFELEAGSTFQLNASATYDPDQSDTLTFKWYQYLDPSATQWSAEHEVGRLVIRTLNEAGNIVEVTLPPAEKCCVELISREPVLKGQLLHLILEVEDNGSPSLVSYRRILIQTTNERLVGGGGRADSIADAMKDIV